VGTKRKVRSMDSGRSGTLEAWMEGLIFPPSGSEALDLPTGSSRSGQEVDHLVCSVPHPSLLSP
jgi:hypothetical protein